MNCEIMRGICILYSDTDLNSFSLVADLSPLLSLSVFYVVLVHRELNVPENLRDCLFYCVCILLSFHTDHPGSIVDMEDEEPNMI
jgi:hypothetical protein